MSKGSAKAATGNLWQDKFNANKYNANADEDRNLLHEDRSRALGVSDELFPFLKGEMSNPTGYGPETVAKMLTKGGQAVSGVAGRANEAANLAAGRTGNASALSGIIGDTTRAGMAQNAENALGVDIANENLKENQRQSGAKGLSDLMSKDLGVMGEDRGMYSEDVNTALQSLGLMNKSVEDWTNAKQAANQNIQGWVNTGIKAASLPLSGGMSAFTGGITPGVTPEQTLSNSTTTPWMDELSGMPWGGVAPIGSAQGPG